MGRKDDILLVWIQKLKSKRLRKVGEKSIWDERA